MKIQEQRQGEVAVLRPEGPLAGDDADEFRAAVLRAAGANLGRCVVDMAAVTFADSRGLEAMLDVSDELSAGGQTCRLSGVNKTVRQVLELTGLVSHFEYFDDVIAAVRSLL